MPSDNILNVKIDYSQKVNFAYQQNAIPVIRQLLIRNDSEDEYKNISFNISSTPSFCKDYEVNIASLPSGKEYAFSDLPIKLDYTFLSEVSEKTRGSFDVNISATDNNGQITLESNKQYPIEVLPYDIWPGVSIMPELLAAFVTPNNDSVELLLKETAHILKSRIGDGALSGYQSRDKRRVYATVNAIFDAVKKLDITYSNPAASFEETGQRIRFPQKIYESRLATCLDLAILMASIMEQCGLHPLLLLHQGHAYAGCFLVEESLPNPIEDDLQSIRKRSKLDEIVVFETTMAATSGPASFDQAVAAAEKHLTLDDKFHMALDIHTARSTHITPLPIMREGLDLSVMAEVEPDADTTMSVASKRELKNEIVIDSSEETPQTRIDNWKRQLLDMTLRNRLLNFKETKQAIPIACNAPDKLEDSLAAERIFKILESTQILDGSDPRSSDLLQAGEDKNVIHSFLDDELKNSRLRSYLTDNELNKRLLKLFRTARTDLEEGGVNTLFLALGFLEWIDQGGEIRKAPLIMLPIKLTRKSVRHGFSIERYDDDSSVNVTLLEMLKRDYELNVPGVDPPPEDESGLDVDRIFQLFKQAIKNMKGWEIKEDVWLSRFSFSKFIMWKDLNNRIAQLMQNPVVNHLVNNPGEKFDDNIDGVRAEDIDKTFGYDAIYSPLSADSSQLAAVISSEKGKTFVLHGPPGTGKSQTITNMIAHCLAKDKRVLFVSEKRAALEVVHKRLCNIGLEPFCLELHSNKSGKMEVLQQFKQSLDFGNRRTPEEWQRVTSKLNRIRQTLNCYESELHKIYPNGFSVYNSFSYLLGKDPDSQFKNIKDLNLSAPAMISAEELDISREICEKLEIRNRQLSPEVHKALETVHHNEWTPQWEKDFLASVDKLSDSVKALKEHCIIISEQLNFTSANLSEAEMYNLLELVAGLIAAPLLPKGFMASNWTGFTEKIGPVISAGQERDKLRDELSTFKPDDLMGLDIPSMQKTYQDAAEKFFIMKWLEQRKVLALLRKCQKVGAVKLPGKQAFAVMEKIQKLTETENTVKEAATIANDRFGKLWNNGDPDWNKITEIIKLGTKLHYSLGAIVDTTEDAGASLREKIGTLLENAPDSLSKSSKFADKVNTLASSWNDYMGAFVEFNELAKAENDKSLHENNFLDAVILKCNQLTSFKKYLHGWCLWLQGKSEALKHELQPIVDAIESGELTSNIQEAFERKYREAFINQVMQGVEVLRDFLGDEQDHQVKTFIELDKQYSKLSSQLAVSMLASKLPGARNKSAPKGTAIGLIQRECIKKRGHMPVRKLLKEVKSILWSMKPCMLMSPISIAQYLPPDQENFDIVIFDEASQIPIWDAIGAIARASQCVIVGDPKQLPPTNFFSRADGGNEESEFGNSGENDFVELESILDECIASGLDNSYLQWHYRSKHESLISFSNYHYYDNRLYTFPAALNTGIGTKFVHTDGVYDKGKTRTNKKEAETLVNEVISRLNDPAKAIRSIGIVTFSQAQQNLIEDLLDNARIQNPEIEQYFTDKVAEPVFVKNLENVQGDERDVIFFSICYARDQVGKLSMNFGPLNRDGGERRLNVAITRAREEVVVFSSIRAEDIDLSRTKAVGSAHLKSYLKYAECGIDALFNITEGTVTTDDYDSLFEQEVAEFLREKGYNIHTQVGCSGYRIDLAVTHPEKPGRYIIGIECDGATYHRSATARDRDQLRQSVLEGLGWEIHRVWSTSWWHNPEYAQEKLITAVQNALENANEETRNPILGTTNEITNGNESIEIENDADDDIEEYEEIIESTHKDFEYALEYPETSYPSDVYDQELFYEPFHQNAIKKELIGIINNEGPILEKLLQKRICENWGFRGAGSRIRKVLEQCFPKNLVKTTQKKDKVYWPENAAPEQYKYFRYPNDDKESRRMIDDIPVEELANGMHYIMTEYLGCHSDVLYKETAALFGISRVTAKSTPYLESALMKLRERGVIE